MPWTLAGGGGRRGQEGRGLGVGVGRKGVWRGGEVSGVGVG